MSVVSASALSRQGFLRGMSAEHLGELAVVARSVEVPAGQRLFDVGGTADRFWLLQNGRVELDLAMPGHGRLTVETLGIGDVLGWSWLFPPYQWRFGALVTRPVHAFEFDGRAVRAMSETDSDLGYDLVRRFLAVVLDRLQATRVRLTDRYLTGDARHEQEASS